MEDKSSHIDSFLDLKLNTFGANPDANAWDKISHSLHAADMAISANLKDFESQPPEALKQAIFTGLANGIHPIDTALYDRLSGLESSPHVGLSELPLPEQEKKKRKRIFWILIPMMMVSGLTAYLLITHRGDSLSIQKEIQVSETGKINAEPEMADTENISEQAPASEKTQNHYLPVLHANRVKNPTAESLPLHAGVQSIPEGINRAEATPLNEAGNIAEDAEFSSFLKPATIYSFPYRLTFETISGAGKNTVQFPRNKFRIPIGLTLSIGYQNEISSNARISENNKAHKDLYRNYQMGNSGNRSGINLSIRGFYQPYEKILFRSGINYNSSSKTSNYRYVHTDVPVYGLYGNIIGYFTRPAAQSPTIDEPVKTNYRAVSIPVEALYRLFAVNHFSLWLGGGADLQIMNAFKSKVYSFEKESMTDISRIRTDRVQPIGSLLMQYELRTGVSFSLQLLGQYRTQDVEDEMLHYRSDVITPSFNIGLTLLPNFFTK